MKTNRWREALAGLVLAGMLSACVNSITTATGGSSSQSQGGGSDGPGASPSPGAGGTLPEGSTVRVGLFGQSCPQGTTPPNNGSRTILPGCTGFMTATPKDAQGLDLAPAVHGPSCVWSVFGSLNLLDAGNPFNKDARCASPGDSNVSAVVKNVTGSVGITCAANANARAASVDNPHRVYFWSDDATEEQKGAAIARDQARYRSSAQVRASNCNNCHPPLDPDPGSGGGGW